MHTRIPIAALLVAAASVALLPSLATAVEVAVRAGKRADVETFDPVPGTTAGSGTICVGASAGTDADPKAGTSFTACTITIKNSDEIGAVLKEASNAINASGTYNGKQNTKPKFVDPGTAELVGNSDVLTARASDSNRLGTTTATAQGDWTSSINRKAEDPNKTTTAKHNVLAKVTKTPNFPMTRFEQTALPIGRAAARSTDPMFFSFETPGAFDFRYAIGDSSIETDESGDALPEFSIRSDDLTGVALAEFEVAFEGVSYLGRVLDAPLFILAIGGGGDITSADELAILFDPWEGLGLSTAQITDVVSAIRSALHALPDGGFGLSPGEAFEIFGPHGLLPTLRLHHAGGEVVLHSDVRAAVETVAEPPVWMLLSFLILVFPSRRLARLSMR